MAPRHDSKEDLGTLIRKGEVEVDPSTTEETQSPVVKEEDEDQNVFSRVGSSIAGVLVLMKYAFGHLRLHSEDPTTPSETDEKEQ
tara:strand:- start:86 stop:340 length:255 start_codon:yes stop_codon:yes gene_type:complete